MRVDHKCRDQIIAAHRIRVSAVGAEMNIAGTIQNRSPIFTGLLGEARDVIASARTTVVGMPELLTSPVSADQAADASEEMMGKGIPVLARAACRGGHAAVALHNHHEHHGAASV